MGFIEEMKWWHWIAVSLVLGAALGYINKNNVQEPGAASVMEPEAFEQQVLKKPINDNGIKPWIRNIWVYPPVPADHGRQMQLISFQWADESRISTKGLDYKPCYTMAPFPYTPTGSRSVRAFDDAHWPGTSIYIGKPGDTLESIVKSQYGSFTIPGRQAILFANNSLSGPRIHSAKDIVIHPGQAYFIPWSADSNHSMKDFLDAARTNANWISYHYAFWHAANIVYPLWIGASFVVVGLIWPAVASILIRGGLGRAREKDEYDLSRFKGGSDAKPAVAAAVVTDEDQRKLEALEAALMASLESSPKPARKAEEKEEEAPVRKLSNKPLPPPKEEAPSAETKLKDEELVYDAFYPVARGKKKQ